MNSGGLYILNPIKGQGHLSTDENFLLCCIEKLFAL